MKKLFFAFVFLLFAMPAEAQLTTVSGTVTDSNTVPYAGAQMKMQLVTTAGSPVSGQPTMTVNNQAQCVSAGFGSAPCQVPFQGTVGPFQLSPTGSFTINLQDNTLVTPAATQWLFTINSTGAPPPLGTGPQVCIVQLTITGASQSVSSNFSSCPALGTLGTPGQFNVKTFGGAVGDTHFARNCVTAGSGSHTVTDATDSPWVSTDIGKFIECINGSTGTASIVPSTTITAFNSTSSIQVSNLATGAAGSGQFCKWFTQDDTAAFQKTTASARQATINTQSSPGVVNGYSQNVIVPPGGYTVSGTIFQDEPVNNGAITAPGLSLIGTPGNTIIYPTSTFVGSPGKNSCWAPATAVGLIATCSTSSTVISGILVEGSNILNTNLGVNSDGLWGNDHCQLCRLSDNRILDWGQNANNGTFTLKSFSGIVDNMFVQNSPSAGSDFACVISASQQVHWRNSVCSNHAGTMSVSSSGARSSTTNQLIFEGQLNDECGGGNGACTQISTNSVVNWIGGGIFGGNPSLVTVDGTSALYLSQANVQVFGAVAANANDFAISSGGLVEATGTTMKSSGTGQIANGPAGATFVDAGGNTWQNCLSGTCTTITATDFTTHGFSGGIVPKASVTHTPNTCYAVTGNLLATAQNLCVILLDQTYQLLTIAAQSGGTTPANSSCATPPVITLSDGTRSATMTMTSGQTTWCSATSGSCTASATSNINQVFASGALLTVSIGANTCATPPSNVSVNYDLQSVLNP